MLESRSNDPAWKLSDEFEGPSSGVFFYLNDTLVLRQYHALEEELRIKGSTESVSSETNVGASIQAPIGSVEKSLKSAGEKSVTRELPEISPTYAAARLVKRFDKDTNVFKWGFYPSWSVSSDWHVRKLEDKGVKFTSAQKEALERADQEDAKRVFQKLVPNQVMLYHGELAFKKNGDETTFEIDWDKVLKVTVTGRIDPKFAIESHLFSTVESKGAARTMGSRMMMIIEKIASDSNGVYNLKVFPCALW